MRSKLLTVAIAASLGVASFSAIAQSADGTAKPKHRTGTAAAAPGISASELALLRDQIAALQAKVAELEQRENAQSEINVSQAQAVQATQAKVEAASKAPLSFDNIRYKGVKITLGGFVEAATITRSRNEAADISSNYAAIPFKNVPNGHQQETRLSERQSRFSILAEGDATDNIHLAGYYELDFQGGAQTANSNESNSFNPRTRNVYLTVDWKEQGLHLLGGQNWSLLTLNKEGIIPRNELTPPSIDAQYVPGFAWARQTQIRLVKDWNQQYWLGLSIENPQTTYSGGPNNSFANGQITGGSGFDNNNKLSVNRLPDVIAKFAADPGWGHYEIFALGRAFYNRFGGQNHNVYGGGFGVGMILPLVPKELEFQFSGLTGKGIGRYGSAQLADVTERANGSIAPIKENMVLAGLTYHPTPDWDVYLFGGQEKQNSQAFFANGKPYGVGSPFYDNSGCDIEGSAAATCVGNSKKIWQGTLGFWWRAYQGRFGRLQVGAQYSHTERQAFEGVGGAPIAKDNMFFTSLRYYPF